MLQFDACLPETVVDPLDLRFVFVGGPSRGPVGAVGKPLIGDLERSVRQVHLAVAAIVFRVTRL